MRSTKGSARYAKALLELAIEKNNLDKVLNDMTYLLNMKNETREFYILLESPVISADRKIAIFNELFDQFEEMSKMFIKLITNNRREFMLDEIAASFISQVKAYRGIVPVTLISAKKLNDATKKLILDKVQNSVNGKLEVNEKIDESLIGGFIVQMENKQIDASIASEFNNLKQRLTR